MDSIEENYKTKSLISAWKTLNEIKAEIKLKESELSTKYDVHANRLKEILVSCSINNDSMINTIVSADNISKELRKLYIRRDEHRIYINNMIDILKLNDKELCIAFLREYLHLNWENVSNKVFLSIRQCQRYYYKYKKKTEEKNGVWTNF